MSYYVITDRCVPLAVIRDEREVRRMMEGNPRLDFYKTNRVSAWLTQRRIDAARKVYEKKFQPYSQRREN